MRIFFIKGSGFIKKAAVLVAFSGIIISAAIKVDPLYGQDYNLVTDSTKMFWPAQILAKPGYLESVTDPDFGTKIIRVTGDPGTIIPAIGGTWKDIVRHGYSKIPAWNADESILYLETQKGGPAPLFLDGETYEVLFSKTINVNEKRWHPADPDLMVILSDNYVKTWNIWNNELKILASISGYSDCQMGPWEGNLSNDGKWLAVFATRNSDGKKVGFALDLEHGTKYPDIDFTGVTVDWISISFTGKYIVLNGYINGGDDQTQVYDINGNKIGSLWSEYGRPSHYDLTVDENGDEVAVGVSKSSPDNGHVIKRRLTDGAVTVLTYGGYATHTSTRCPGRPGWAISSFSHRGPSNWEPYYNEIAAIKLDGSRVERICHIRGLYKTYDNEAQPCPSPSGSRIIFASDWESDSLPIQGYVADFRDLIIAGEEKISEGSDEISIYPNPASDYIMIPYKYINCDYRIISVNGQLVGQGKINEDQIDISALSMGLYIIELVNSSENKRCTFSVINNR
jgi:hypothetical protein